MKLNPNVKPKPRWWSIIPMLSTFTAERSKIGSDTVEAGVKPNHPEGTMKTPEDLSPTDSEVTDQKGRDYWIDPEVLDRISITLSVQDGDKSFSEACKEAAAIIATQSEVRGVERVPKEGPFIVIPNHPVHFDFTLLHQIFALREDLRILAKSSPLIDRISTDHVILLHKNGPHAKREDIEILRHYLSNGGSLLAVPWGSLDHMGSNYAEDRAVENVLRYAGFANATILPVVISVEWGDDKIFPLQSASVAIQNPVIPTENGHNRALVSSIVSSMFREYVGSLGNTGGTSLHS